MKKRFLAMLLALGLAMTACSTQGQPDETQTQANQEEEEVADNNVTENIIQDSSPVFVEVSDQDILVEGGPIAADATEAVYLQYIEEVHPDVSGTLAGIQNAVITITQPGHYVFSGILTDGQIRVDIDESLAEETVVELNNLSIECRTAPAILVKSAHDPEQPGESSVILRLAEGSQNTVTGSHTAKYTDENEVEQKKNDGAISSNVSIRLDGAGALTVQADNEGIESKMHMTIDGGNYDIYAHDDSLNASEDNMSVLTINGGHIHLQSTLGEEGDGMDSNGSIVINGGEVIAVGHESSMDSGLDSDLGITINGGRVLGVGNMYDEVTNEGTQPHMTLEFAEKQSAGTPIVLLDSQDQVVFAYTPSYASSVWVLSLPELVEGETYHLYTGGTLTGTESDGLYSQVDSYEKGTLMQYGGQAAGMGGRGMGAPPEGFNPENGPEGFDPENMPEGQRPEMPEDFDPENMPEGGLPEMPEGFDPENMPQGGRGPGGPGSQATQTEVSTDFTLTSEMRYFNAIRASS